MKRWIGRCGLVISATVVSLNAGCYHAVVDSGRPQSGTVLEDRWADAFLGGLVPPNPVETSQRCPSGISRVETRLSFLNLVAGSLTFGIYTPMHIKVFCSSAGGEPPHEAAQVFRVPADAGEDEIEGALSRAARHSARTGEAAYLVVERE